MHTYLKLRGTAPGPLFVDEKSRQRLRGNVLSVVARNLARHAGLKGTFSGYSFRIGGATLMAAAGVSEPVIQAVAGWKSDVFLRYLRSVAAASTNVSQKMGL